jgi:hypothetical protein
MVIMKGNRAAIQGNTCSFVENLGALQLDTLCDEPVSEFL